VGTSLTWDLHPVLRHVAKSEDQVEIKWLQHDGRTFGSQFLNDSKSNVELTTTFYKVRGEKGGDWVMKIKGNAITPPTNDDNPARLSIIVYIGMENQQSGTIQLDNPTPPIHKVRWAFPTLESNLLLLLLCSRSKEPLLLVDLLHQLAISHSCSTNVRKPPVHNTSFFSGSFSLFLS
jgi:hypothetical protein